MTSSVVCRSVRGDGQEPESGPGAPYPLPIPVPQSYSSQELLQAAQEGEMVGKLRCWGGRQSQEGLECEQMKLGEGVVRYPGRDGGLTGRSLEGASDWTLLPSSGLEGYEGLSVGRGSPISHPYPSAPQISLSASRETASSGYEPLPEVMLYLGRIGGKGCFGHPHLIGQINYIAFSRL